MEELAEEEQKHYDWIKIFGIATCPKSTGLRKKYPT
jgi:hypothetical protein